MWSNSAHFLTVRVKVQSRWGFTFPVSLRVLNEWFEALSDIARVGETVMKFVPLPQEGGARRKLSWFKTLLPSRMISYTHILIKDISNHKGFDLVDVETGDVQVKVSLR
ncbi:hypothetical protein [Desulfitobacterium metallireducens]|uniref:Uncharacterized protein n=1 Tax=Desulfitobacterium metallireducens DSM 15288 TaxID=871968 RepID=W0EAH3_9FIRM|nr:hypothetical protein [Desulfitobacterium metallireducens]AHF06199.1 hypothetical protein DESME_03370 [Desulfitobacterium metallireducens DSM 15288]